jgi:hypothetical protein
MLLLALLPFILSIAVSHPALPLQKPLFIAVAIVSISLLEDAAFVINELKELSIAVLIVL